MKFVIYLLVFLTTNCLFTTKLKDDDNFSYKGFIRCSADDGESLLKPKSVEFYLVKIHQSLTSHFMRIYKYNMALKI